MTIKKINNLIFSLSLLSIQPFILNLNSMELKKIFKIYENNVKEENGKFTRKNFWDSFYANQGNKEKFFKIYRKYRDKKTPDINLDNYKYLFKTKLYGNKQGITLKSKLNKLKNIQCGNKNCLSYLIETENYYGNNINFIISKLFVEGMDPNGYSYKGAIGLGQIIRSTGKEECGMNFKDLKNIENNIDCLSLINSDSFKKFKYSKEKYKLSAIRYHGGQGSVNAYLKDKYRKNLEHFILNNPKTYNYQKIVLSQKNKLDFNEKLFKK